MKKADSLLCDRKNWYCWIFHCRAYLPTTNGLVAGCIPFLAPLRIFLFISWMRHPHYGEGNVSSTLLASPKGYRTMLAIHDQFTQQMCDRLKTACMGLGLVRLLQDAKQFEEARTTLYLLENDFQGVASDKASKKPSKANRLKGVTRTVSCSSGSTRTDAAEMRPQPLSIA